jgi:SAM-dependent methyltransferase
MVGARESHSQTRALSRTAVVWAALSDRLDRLASTSDDNSLHVLDIGGGTGGFAVRVAELGHRVTVVDPSPDALAILDRRSRETGVEDRVTGLQGDLSTLPALRADGSFETGSGVDAVLCHGVLEVVDDPADAVAGLRDVLRPGGLLSLLCAQRHATVLARAMAGHFDQALATLTGAGSSTVPAHPGPPHRFTADEVAALLVGAGFAPPTLHAVRVFSDLVPSSLVDLEPGAAASLAALEAAVAERPEYLTLATQVHALSVRT